MTHRYRRWDTRQQFDADDGVRNTDHTDLVEWLVADLVRMRLMKVGRDVTPTGTRLESEQPDLDRAKIKGRWIGKHLTNGSFKYGSRHIGKLIGRMSPSKTHERPPKIP